MYVVRDRLLCQFDKTLKVLQGAKIVEVGQLSVTFTSEEVKLYGYSPLIAVLNSFSDKMMRPCMCVSPRMAGFLAGVVNMILGLTGISLLGLNQRDRHIFLDPLLEVDLEVAKNDTIGETLQFFIEYLLPSLGIFFLGLVLVTAATTMSRCMTVFAFLLSTLIMTGCVAGLLSLTVSGVDLVGALPLIVVSLIQIFIYWVTIDFNQFRWDFVAKDDKKSLV